MAKFSVKMIKMHGANPNKVIAILVLLFLPILFLLREQNQGLPAIIKNALTWKINQEKHKMLPNQTPDSNATLDFTKLRMDYTKSELYNPVAERLDPLKGEMIAAINSGDFSDALKIAHEILEKNPVCILAHKVSAIAYGQLNDTKKEDFHSRSAEGLLTSILQSGDGKTEESAFVVISMDEEYAVVGSQGFQVKTQALIEASGHNYDVLEVYDPKSLEHFKLCFNIDIYFEWQQKDFNEFISKGR